MVPYAPHGVDGSSMIRRVVAVGNPTMIHLLLGVDPAPIGVYPYHPG